MLINSGQRTATVQESYHLLCLILPSKRKVTTALSLTVQYNFRFIILSLASLPNVDTELPLQASNTLKRQILLIIFPQVLIKCPI